MDVEQIGVSTVSGRISRCPHLKPVISTNDKTLLTDGHIEVFSSTTQSVDNWQGRVTVQVKGRTHRRLNAPAPRRKKRSTSNPKVSEPSAPAFSISKVELTGFQKDSGVLYFYVSVDELSGEGTPYYALLSPFTIDSYLQSAPKKQKKIPIRLKPFPHDVGEIEDIVVLALKTRDQNVSTGFDPKLFEDFEKITLHTVSGLDFSAPRTLAPGSEDYALVLTTKGGLSIPLPGVFEVIPPEYIETPFVGHITSGDVTFTELTRQRVSVDEYHVRISDGLTLIARKTAEEIETEIRLSLESTLDGRLKSVKFYIAMLDSGAVKFDDESVPFDISVTQQDKELRSHLKTLRDLGALFDELDVDKTLINLANITPPQLKQLLIAHRAIVMNEELVDQNGESARVIQAVGNWNLMFIISPGSVPGSWRVINPFDTKVRQQFVLSTGNAESIPVTAYETVSDEHLITTVNMNLTEIVGAYEAISELPTTVNLANRMVIRLVRAADDNSIWPGKLLDAANALNAWVLEKEPDESHHLINNWQIIARQRELTSNELSAIRKLKRNVTTNKVATSTQYQFACALLLKDMEEADDLMSELSGKELAEIMKWPIWRLYTSKHLVD